MIYRSLHYVVTVVWIWAMPVVVIAQDIELVNTIVIPGNHIDRSGLAEPLGASLWQDLFGGISALEYSGTEDLYWALPDRGPLDGAVDWSCRLHAVRLSLESRSRLNYRVEKTVLLTNGARTFSGLATRYVPTADRTARLDPEGLRQTNNNRFFVSDEYGPHLLEFDLSGRLIKRHAVPKKYFVAKPGPDKARENADNSAGRQGNRGMEGLAISPTGDRLYGLLQSPLLQDCQRTASGKPTGLNCRMMELHLKTGRHREFLYRLDHPKNKLNEVLALNDHQFLVIERDGKSGREAIFKKIMKIDISAASDIHNLNKVDDAESINPVQKEVFIDLLDPRFGLAGSAMPEKIEGLTFGPRLADGRQTLLVASDNDFQIQQPTMIYCFALKDESTSH